MSLIKLKQGSSEAQAGMLARLRRGLEKTRSKLFSGIDELFRQKKAIDGQLLEEIETRLLLADLGVAATTRIVDAFSRAMDKKSVHDFNQVMAALQIQMVEILQPVEQTLVCPAGGKPFVILVIGVNGSGKTTTIGKLAKWYRGQGKQVVLAAGDTFRAAAIEQIRHWGEQTDSSIIAQHSGADAAAVIYDALQSARANNADIVIADTAGRLHNKKNLMQELGKIRRTITKFDPGLPVEVLLVLDAGTGQNALAQARQFNEIVDVTGITITKLDGTAKGGVVFAIADALSIPIRFIGIGEQPDDLRPFRAVEFVAALLEIDA